MGKPSKTQNFLLRVTPDSPISLPPAIHLPPFQESESDDNDDCVDVESSNLLSPKAALSRSSSAAAMGGGARSPTNPQRSKQRHYLSNKLKSLKTMSPRLYDEIMVGPALQYFLASLCDWQVKDENKKRLGLRYCKTPEVQRLLHKIHKCKFVGREIKNADSNCLISVLKEVLTEFPGGIFADCNEEFLSINQECPPEIALAYANGLIENLPIFLRQFTYLVCKCLRNLARQSSGTIVDSYTDLLLLFTPVLFPSSVGDVSRFLRATRISLILIDLCDTVFRPHLSLSLNSANTRRTPASEAASTSDSAYHSDEDFFKDIVDSLNSLHESFDSRQSQDTESTTETDSGAILSDDECLTDLEMAQSKVGSSCGGQNEYYTITYDMDT